MGCLSKASSRSLDVDCAFSSCGRIAVCRRPLSEIGGELGLDISDPACESGCELPRDTIELVGDGTWPIPDPCFAVLASEAR